MTLALQTDRTATRFRQVSAPRGVAQSAYLLDEAATLAWRAKDAFDSRAELKEWLACAVAQRLRGKPRCSAGECGEAARLACSMRFRGSCAFAMQPRELDDALSRTPTARLQALLRLERDSRRD